MMDKPGKIKSCQTVQDERGGGVQKCTKCFFMCILPLKTQQKETKILMRSVGNVRRQQDFIICGEHESKQVNIAKRYMEKIKIY